MSQRVRRILIALCAAVVALVGTGAPAHAHGFASTAYADVKENDAGRPRTTVALEYDLLVVSAADAAHDDALFRQGTAAFESGDARGRAAVLDAHADAAVGYVTGRFTLSSDGRPCVPRRHGGFTTTRRDGAPYAVLTLDWTCPGGDAGLEVRSTLFPDAEQYVKGTKTIVTYAVDGLTGSAALDAAHPSFLVGQSWYQRFWEFFRLGAEHLLTGIDHILFLLALIAGSRSPREVVLTATAFTLAHSVTFLLAALGLVEVPAGVVEPVIALSIAVVAGWHLWRLARRDDRAPESREPGGTGHLRLDRAGWTRLGVVFCFGLVHGLGFAGALGIEAAWSWTLLWSLLVFNLGIEAVQLAIVGLLFPALAVLRRRSPRAGRRATGLVAAGVAVMGLTWFAQRLAGL
ncbi:HupE/UreJ family protein [Streptomyces sp. SS1-1]|uniref:HupE/UreJ family protein n=1 Tax=Streptomyces sp. SS1-1 TaxID=2651869 RepID=UPI00124FAEB7|nr:HupE/UreJ family protein [Streptomyces sp. SS1-1]KAB2971043.1 HupE/UreJ family protein [Streptomyces sp. SS1-1]